MSSHPFVSATQFFYLLVYNIEQRVFYALHEWIFAGMAPWHFYFQDSLMTTMLTEPLFGSISILLVGTAFVFWLLLSALIKRILA